jgi:hypothetical protein
MTGAGAPPPTDLNAAYKAYTASLNTAGPTSTSGTASLKNAMRKIPAFARKYSLACSACHTTWPELNPFGQAFKDRGYQLGNDKDSPIWQNPSYWPISMRTTPQYHVEVTTNQPVDAVAGDGSSCCVSKTVTQQGFDISGIDFLMLGTLYKNITFGLVPTLDPDGSAGIETAFVRFDNIGSSWFNVKFGKFELDNLVSEKRIETLSNNGSFYAQYHFTPVGDINTFAMGDNQIGVELMGHNPSSYTRYSFALISNSDGEAGLPAGSGKGVNAVFTASQAWQSAFLGPTRVGIFGVLGQHPTSEQTSGGEPVPGTGYDNKPFYRVGLTAQVWLGPVEILPQFVHAQDNVYLALGIPTTSSVPSGSKDAVWNGGFIEAHYVPNAQLMVIGRWETVRMSQQADPSFADNYGNMDAFVLGVRSYPIMFSRAGVAFHVEYSFTNSVGVVPLSGDGVGLPPMNPTLTVKSSSLLLAVDFAF